MSLKEYQKKIVIGIAGPSGSGKTTITKKLAKILKAKIIKLDDYWKYKNLTKIPLMKKWKKGLWKNRLLLILIRH